MSIFQLISNVLLVVIISIVILFCIICMHESRLQKRMREKIIPCSTCGSKKIRLNILVSEGYQYRECLACGRKFQDTSDSEITVTGNSGRYALEKPVVNQNGKPVEDG